MLYLHYYYKIIYFCTWLCNVLLLFIYFNTIGYHNYVVCYFGPSYKWLYRIHIIFLLVPNSTDCCWWIFTTCLWDTQINLNEHITYYPVAVTNDESRNFNIITTHQWSKLRSVILII